LVPETDIPAILSQHASDLAKLAKAGLLRAFALAINGIPHFAFNGFQPQAKSAPAAK